MRLTSKARYAVTALLDLALNSADGHPISLSEVSERQMISLSYLEQLFSRMRKAGLVDSVRGASGGYFLRLPAGDISIVEIIEAVDEPMHATGCNGGDSGCTGSTRCITHHLWEDLTEQIHGFLSNKTLQTLMDDALPNKTASGKTHAQSQTVAHLPHVLSLSVGEP